MEETLYNTDGYVYIEASDFTVTGDTPWRVHPKKNFAYVADSSGNILSVSSGITEADLAVPKEGGFTKFRTKKNEKGQLHPFLFTIPGPLEARPVPTDFDLFNGDYKKYGKDYALLFATNTYGPEDNLENPINDPENPKDLENPINDAIALSKELRKYGFIVELKTEVTTADITDKLKEYARPELYGSDSQLFIFFAGHGVYDPDFREGHIVGMNSKLGDEGYDSFLSYERIRHILNGLPCQNILLMLDVCYGGTFDYENQLTQGSTRAFKKKEHQTAKSQKFYTGPDRNKLIKSRVGIKTRWYMSSGGQVEVEDGVGEGHSPYAIAILNALRSTGGSDKVLTISEMEQHILKVYEEKKIPYASASGPFGNNQKSKGFLFIHK